ncbi:MAG: SUMF1/EgtB/PvdO family nonheme iron enzyme [Myxococcales bacterium]|nr:SUMF1/EgtB/PvdO family nonheme iron enzyme [Myxococcales bacterium]MCB9520579.1 SUMF1/EgtB/PvdO family nonheme iron enzyme [Myxococcales bacterium]MCB9531502.1 SUMF1/EgtB/PvdO family nonheme iron enzyme [Myxococcales bacterium]
MTRTASRKLPLLAVASLSLPMLASACRIDFDADVPCDLDEDCPSGQICDPDFFRCVDGEATDTGGRTDTEETGRDVGSDVSDVPSEDVPADGSADASDTDVVDDADTTADAPDGSGDAGEDVPLDPDVDPDVPTCVPTGPEVCDGADNDCNGTIDDPPVCDSAGPCGGGMSIITLSGGTSVCIDSYEASRSDASAASPGTLAVATSRAGVRPWSTVSLADAQSACAAAGKRVCSALEWQTACQGASAHLYPYGNTYEGATCNGSNTPPLDQAAPTGQFTGCLSDVGTFDQSGNLAEWTSDGLLRGGAFADIQLNLRCSSRTTPDATAPPLPTFGFRCCKDPE